MEFRKPDEKEKKEENFGSFSSAQYHSQAKCQLYTCTAVLSTKNQKKLSSLPYYKHLINKAYILYSHVHVVVSLFGRILTLVMCTDFAVFFLFSHDLCQDSFIIQTSCLVNKSCHDFTLGCDCYSHMQKNSERTTCMLPGLYSRQFSTDTYT